MPPIIKSYSLYYQKIMVKFHIPTVLLLALISCAVGQIQPNDLRPWEHRRGDAVYGNVLWNMPPSKEYSSDYVRYPGGLVHYAITGAIPNNGSFPSDRTLLARQAITNMIEMVKAAGGSYLDIARNPVRSNDQATLENDPNNALVIRSSLATATHLEYNLLNSAGQVSWPKYPSDRFIRPPGRSYVIMPVEETIVMLVTAFTGSSRGNTHSADPSNLNPTITFNNLPFNWTALSPSDQDYLSRNGFEAPNGEFYHYSSPTSLSYTPDFVICDGPGHSNSPRFCRKASLRSCERAFSMMNQTEPRFRNSDGLVVGGNLIWKGNNYNCTDVINYNGGGALWCRIRDDNDIAVAFEIAEAHHDNGARNLGFEPRDDLLLDIFLTNPSTQWSFIPNFAQRRYESGKYPAIVPNFGRLVGGDKIELTGEHSTGRKYYSGQNPNRRTTPASLEGWNTVRVGSEALTTAFSGHVCNHTTCYLPTSHLERLTNAFESAFDDLTMVGHDDPVESVTYVTVFVDETLYLSVYKPLVKSVVQSLWPNPSTRPVVVIEPHRGLWPYVSQIGDYSVQSGNTVTVNLRSVKIMSPGQY